MMKILSWRAFNEEIPWECNRISLSFIRIDLYLWNLASFDTDIPRISDSKDPISLSRFREGRI